jgi:hypothetical protein
MADTSKWADLPDALDKRQTEAHVFTQPAHLASKKSIGQLDSGPYTARPSSIG